MAEISSLSVEYVFIEVSFVDPVTGLSANPTGDAVAIAFTGTTIDPVGGDWAAATWRAGGPPYVAQILVGVGGLVLAKGNYRAWAKITSNPELPVLRAGFLKVT